MRDTGRSFEPIFMKMKFTRSARMQPRVNPIVFGKNRPNGTTDPRENLPVKSVFRLSFARYEFSRGKNYNTVFGRPFTTEKGTFIFAIRRPVPWKMVVFVRNYFSRLYRKILFFLEKIGHRKIFEISFLTKRVILTFVARRPPTSCLPTNGLSRLFPENIVFFFRKIY